MPPAKHAAHEEADTASRTLNVSSIQKFLAVIVCIATIFGNYVVSKTVFDYRLGDTERRIVGLEHQDGGKMTVEIAEHTKQLNSLAEIVSKDHDLLVRVVTMLERDHPLKDRQ